MQQVNLYTDDFRPKKVILPLEHILLLPVLVGLILVGVSFLLYSNLTHEKQELANKEARIAKMHHTIEILEAKAKLQRLDDSLDQANKRLSSTIEARQKMVALLDTVVVKDDKGGFSNFLASLARQKVEGLWLDAIKIGASGKTMALEGFTLNAESVPVYLKNLRQEPSFMDRSFTVFELLKDKGKSKNLKFSLRSNAQSDGNNQLIGSSVSSILKNTNALKSTTMKSTTDTEKQQ